MRALIETFKQTNVWSHFSASKSEIWSAIKYEMMLQKIVIMIQDALFSVKFLIFINWFINRSTGWRHTSPFWILNWQNGPFRNVRTASNIQVARFGAFTTIPSISTYSRTWTTTNSSAFSITVGFSIYPCDLNFIRLIIIFNYCTYSHCTLLYKCIFYSIILQYY